MSGSGQCLPSFRSQSAGRSLYLSCYHSHSGPTDLVLARLGEEMTSKDKDEKNDPRHYEAESEREKKKMEMTEAVLPGMRD